MADNYIPVLSPVEFRQQVTFKNFSATTGNFSGDVSAANGTFLGDISAVNGEGTFSSIKCQNIQISNNNIRNVNKIVASEIQTESLTQTGTDTDMALLNNIKCNQLSCDTTGYGTKKFLFGAEGILADIDQRLDDLGFSGGNIIKAKVIAAGDDPINAGYVAKIGKVIYGYFYFEYGSQVQTTIKNFEDCSLIKANPPTEDKYIMYRKSDAFWGHLKINTEGVITSEDSLKEVSIGDPDEPQFTYYFWYATDGSFDLGGTVFTTESDFTGKGTQGSSKTIAALEHEEGESIHIIEIKAVCGEKDISNNFSFSIDNIGSYSYITITNEDTKPYTNVSLTIRYKTY